MWKEEEINGVIYKATNKINGMMYIGATKLTMKARMSMHYRHSKHISHSHKPFYIAISTQDKDDFVWETIDSADTLGELSVKEVYWIAHYDSNGSKGYNLTTGGEVMPSGKITDDLRKMRSDVMKRLWEERGVMGGNSHSLKDDDILKVKSLLLGGQHSHEDIGKMFNVTKDTIYSIYKGKTCRHLITEEDVANMENNNFRKNEAIKIRDLLIEGKLSQAEIARMLNVDTSTISLLKRGLSWREYITDEDVRKMNEGDKAIKPKRNLTTNEVIKIKILLKEGKLKQKEIAEIYSIGTGTVSKINTGKRYANIKIDDNHISKNGISEIKNSKNEN